MVQFPTLSTGAIAQYPFSTAIQFQNVVVSFIDGAEQRFRNSPGPLHTWTIALAQLNEQEMAKLDQFLIENQGAFGTFSFTDPATNITYPNCSLVGQDFSLGFRAPLSGAITLVVRENRS